MRENTVKHACLAGRVQVGSFIATSDSLVAQIMANSGFEWVLVDMEHGPVPLTALQAAVTAIRTTPTQPFVRAAWNSSAAIQTALDCGVAGIMVTRRRDANCPVSLGTVQRARAGSVMDTYRLCRFVPKTDGVLLPRP